VNFFEGDFVILKLKVAKILNFDQIFSQENSLNFKTFFLQWGFISRAMFTLGQNGTTTFIYLLRKVVS
jgi:hypothetical protein